MEKTKSNMKSLLDKEERALVESLKAARAAASEIFNTKTPTVAMVAGVYERCLTYEDESDIELSIRQLAECANVARDVFEEEPTMEMIFLAYDIVFEQADED